MKSIPHGHVLLWQASIGLREWGIDPPSSWLVAKRFFIALPNQAWFWNTSSSKKILNGKMLPLPL
jgi:hypothetical protein